MYQQVGIVYGCASVGDVVGRGIERKFKKELGLVIVLRVSQESVNREGLVQYNTNVLDNSIVLYCPVLYYCSVQYRGETSIRRATALC